MKLADLQHYFQDGLRMPLNEEGKGKDIDSESVTPEILNQLNRSDKETNDILFGVYQNAYVLRLIEFLQTDLGNLEIYLGDESFDQMARHYIALNPSIHYNARWFGGKLPDFLAQTAPWSELPQLAELAAFELALVTSFDAEDAALFGLEHMSQVEDWGGLVLKPHPAVGRLTLNTNASAIREALLSEQQPPEMIMLEQPEQWIFYRNEELQAMYRLLTDEEAMMWDEMSKGVNFGGLCEMLALYSTTDEAPARAAGYLQAWIRDGLLTAPDEGGAEG